MNSKLRIVKQKKLIPKKRNLKLIKKKEKKILNNFIKINNEIFIFNFINFQIGSIIAIRLFKFYK